jgi:hypothetical protein
VNVKGRNTKGQGEVISGKQNRFNQLQALRCQWFAGVNQGLLPMTISEEESNLFCACHLLNCDEGQWQ